MKTIKKIITVFVSSAMITLSLAGCSQTTSSNSIDTPKEITLCESWNFDGGFHHLQSPNVTNGSFGILYFENNFYETLVNYENGKIVPGLAEKWEISEDGSSYTFYLKKNIKFSDGTPFNAEAVKINFDNMPKILGDCNGSYGLTSTLFNKITTIDEYTVKVQLNTPYYGALQDFTLPLPMAIMSPKGFNKDGTLSENTKTTTLGTGSYMYNGQKENDVYTFVRNPYYNRGESDVDIFHVKIIPDNNTKLLALRSGEIDMIIGSGNVSYDNFKELSMDKKYSAMSSDTIIQTRTVGFHAGKTPFNEKDVRLAANYAINQKNLCDSVFYNMEKPADSVLDKNLPFCNVNCKDYGYNPEKAKQILDHAGWIDSDHDGVREKNGVKLEVSLTYMSDRAMLEDLALLIAAQLKEVGFNVIPKGNEIMTYFREVSNGNFDIAIAITNAIPYDPYLLISRMLSNPVRDNYLAQSFVGVKDADTMINSLNYMTNKEEIQSTYNTLLQELHNNAVIIPISRVKGMAVFNQNKISAYSFYNQPDYIDVSFIQLK